MQNKSNSCGWINFCIYDLNVYSTCGILGGWHLFCRCRSPMDNIFDVSLSSLLISKLRDLMRVRTDRHVPRRTIFRSTQHVTVRARWEKRDATSGVKPPDKTHSVISFYFTPPSFQTQVMYKWIEPKICLEDVTGAESLPPSGEREPCPPCNPGFYNNDTATCSPCPLGTYSDGMKRTENPDLYCIPLFTFTFSSAWFH